MTEFFCLLVCLSVLSCAIGVFALPNSSRALNSLTGLAFGLSLLFWYAQSLTLSALLLFVCFSVVCAFKTATIDLPSGWANWFVCVLTASLLWLLSLFLIWTVDETLAFPFEFAALGLNRPQFVMQAFSQFGWMLFLVVLLGVSLLAGHRLIDEESAS